MPTDLRRLNFPAIEQALGAKLLSFDRVRAWAERRVQLESEIPDWLVELVLCESRGAALDHLFIARQWQRQELPGDEEIAAFDKVNLFLGFLFVRYQRHELSMLDLLIQAGDYTDGPGTRVGIACEWFYSSANEIDGKGTVIRSDRPLAARVTELFAPFADAAHASLHQLQVEGLIESSL